MLLSALVVVGSLLSSSVLAGHWGGHPIVTIVVISTHCAVWGHYCIGMIRVMVVSTDACGECLHCQLSLSS